MTQRANAAAWQAPRRARSHGLPSALFAVTAALVASQYFASFIFLAWFRLDPTQASPFTLARYAYHFGARDDIRRRVWASSAAGLVVALIPAVALILPRRRALHGEARFSTRREVARAGLLSRRGFILSQMGRRFVRLPGQQGVAVAARSRSGKGAGIVIPNLLEWPDSTICVDIKKENWTVTAGYRAYCGQQVFLFDPYSESGNTARWNPLGYVSPHPGLRVNDLQRIADMLYPETPGTDPFWIASARTLFLGIGLYVFETPSLPKTIGEILRQGMASDDEGFAAHWKRLVEGRNSGRYPLSGECVRALYDVIDLSPVTASSIRKTFTSRLDLWLNPLLDAATSANDFDLRELRSKRMSIYVGVNPEDLHRLRPVLSLFFQQAIGLQTRQLPEHNPALRYQVMMVLDEFAALGCIPVIAEAAGFLPGYNVRLMLVIQARAQLREVYGVNGAETILRNLAARIVFGADNYADAREISDELGTTTVKTKTYSKPLFDLWETRSKRSVSVSEQKRALLLPQEVQGLDQDQVIIFYESLRPIRCRKIRYFEDRRFKRCLLPPPRWATPWGQRPTPTPVPSPAGHPEPASSPNGANVAEPVAPLPTRRKRAAEREATEEDIERIEQLTLDDFAIDFSQVDIPKKAEGERLSAQEIERAVESFMTTLRDDGRER